MSATFNRMEMQISPLNQSVLKDWLRIRYDKVPSEEFNSSATVDFGRRIKKIIKKLLPIPSIIK